MNTFPTINQPEGMGCGPACLCLIAKYYGRDVSYSQVRDKCFVTREGVSILGLSDASEKMGFHSIALKTTWHYQWQAYGDLPSLDYRESWQWISGDLYSER